MYLNFQQLVDLFVRRGNTKFLLLLYIIMCTSCMVTVPEDTVEKVWLGSVAGTSWERSAESLTFDSTGKSAAGEIYQFSYCSSINTNAGVYATQVEIQPVTWYLFQKSGSTLNQFGPFPSAQDAICDSSLQIVWTEK